MKIMLCYLKFYFKQQLSGEEHQLTTSHFLFFLNKVKPIKQKKYLTLVI